MPIIGVSDIWKMFEWLHGNEKSNREQDHKRVEGWLDAVYSDINDLSDIWLKISAGRQLSSKEAERGSEILGDIEAMRQQQDSSIGPQPRYFARTIRSVMNFSMGLDRFWSSELRCETSWIVSIWIVYLDFNMSVKQTSKR
jgi:hypothetical protein